MMIPGSLIFSSWKPTNKRIKVIYFKKFTLGCFISSSRIFLALLDLLKIFVISPQGWLFIYLKNLKNILIFFWVKIETPDVFLYIPRIFLEYVFSWPNFATISGLWGIFLGAKIAKTTKQ